MMLVTLHVKHYAKEREAQWQYHILTVVTSQNTFFHFHFNQTYAAQLTINQSIRNMSKYLRAQTSMQNSNFSKLFLMLV